MRKHYRERLSKVLLGELGKELTGHSTHDVEKAIAAASSPAIVRLSFGPANMETRACC